MMLITLLSMLLSVSMSLLLTSNPLGMGLIILLTALLVSAIFSILMSSWLAFLIFLIYVGGMLIMFSYFLALTPNLHLTHLSSFSSSLVFLAVFTTLLYPFSATWTMPTDSSSKLIELLFLKLNQSSMLLLTLVLFLTLVIIVKVSVINKGPLRTFMSYV